MNPEPGENEQQERARRNERIFFDLIHSGPPEKYLVKKCDKDQRPSKDEDDGICPVLNG